MKARIFGFLCSLLLLAASSKGQAIDGVLYTNFNNYYKWRGGAFDSTLLLPQIAASVGRRAGALRYNTTDSSVYSWTGWQWRKVGVELDTTSLSNRIDARVVIGSDASLKSLTITGTNGNGHIHLRHQASLPTATGQSTAIYANSNGDLAYKNDGNYHTTFATSANTADRTYTFQNKSYTVADNADVVKYTDTSSMLDGRLTGITLNTSSAIHTSPVTFSRVGGAWSGTLSLANQSGFTIFRRASGTGTPSFGTIDSSYFGGNFKNQVIAAQDKAIQWDAADSLFSYNQLKKGTFRTYDFDGLSNVSGIPQGSGDCFGITHISSGGTFANLLENNILGISISTGGSATSSPYIAQGYANNTNVSYNVTGANIKSTWMHFRVKTPTLNDGTQRFYTVIGFKNSATANPAESAYFTYDLDGTQTGSAASANWQCVSALAGNREWTTTSSAVPVDTWQTLSIRTTTSSVQFFIDGALVATHTTRIPVAGRLHIQIFKTNGSTARFLHADYATFNQLNNSDR